jgi:large subunit ribosomal protein L30
MSSTTSKLTVKLVRSPIGARASHRATVRGLGLRKVQSESTLEDTPAVRGMINKISYLVQVIDGADGTK